MIAALAFVLVAQVLPAPPSQPNLGYSSIICPTSPSKRPTQANIWTGVSKLDPENKRFMTECLPCAVAGACQNKSVSTNLDPNYSWTRINAGCFPPASPSENVSVLKDQPRSRIEVHEDSGGCSAP